MTAHQIDPYTGDCPVCSARRYEIDDNVAPTDCWGSPAWRTAWQHVERGFEKSERILDLLQQRGDLHEACASLKEVIDQRNAQIADLTRRLSKAEEAAHAQTFPERYDPAHTRTDGVVEEYFRTWMEHKDCNPISDLTPTPRMAEAIELHQQIAQDRLDMAQRTERHRVISMGSIAGTSTNAPPPPDPSHTSTSQTDAAQKREPDQKQIEQGKALTRAFTRA